MADGVLATEETAMLERLGHAYLRQSELKSWDRAFENPMDLEQVARNVAIADRPVAAKLAYDIIDRKPKVDINPSGLKFNPATAKGEIKFNNVNFKYPSRPDLHVLKDFTATFESGKTTALVGPSGSGKSTIIQLLERFYNPESGMIHIDGAELKNFDLRNFR